MKYQIWNECGKRKGERFPSIKFQFKGKWRKNPFMLHFGILVGILALKKLELFKDISLNSIFQLQSKYDFF